jgi:hypothetical protein
MLYSKFIFQAKEKTIKQLENGLWYLEPEWKDIICRDMQIESVEDIEDSFISDWWDVENILRLEVDKRNAQENKMNDVVNWLYDIINQKVDPMMLDSETDLVKNIIESRNMKEQKET